MRLRPVFFASELRQAYLNNVIPGIYAGYSVSRFMQEAV
jgi:hypothetical protein